MKSICLKTLKRLFHTDLIQAKSSCDFTQAQMAERLLMDPWSYIEIDHGKNMAGTLTFVVYLLCVCPAPANFLASLCSAFSEIEHPSLQISTAFQELLEAVSYRKALHVTQIRSFPSIGAFPVCPGCGRTMEREFQEFCDRCGQALDWAMFDPTPSDSL